MNPDKAREEVAREYGFVLYRSYDEKRAAAYIGTDYSTLKRWRREGRTPYVSRGSGVRYMGYHIANVILFGNRAKHLDGGVSSCGDADNRGGMYTVD